MKEKVKKETVKVKKEEIQYGRCDDCGAKEVADEPCMEYYNLCWDCYISTSFGMSDD